MGFSSSSAPANLFVIPVAITVPERITPRGAPDQIQCPASAFTKQSCHRRRIMLP
jgi:hypothetical protein